MSQPTPDTNPDLAIADLLASHGDRIYALGLTLCDNPDNAQDLVQETFLRALKSWESFEGRSQPSTWLHTIAVRTCRRMQRRRAGEPRHMEPLTRVLPSGDEGVIQIPSDDDPEAEAVRHEATDAVLRAVSHLPLDFRLPFVLKEMADLSIAEIAEALDVNPATVKTRLHRARLRVREELAAAIPSREAPSPDHAREECLALLRAKQESLDHGTTFPIPDDELCERCRGVFATLEYGRDICRTLACGEMPAEVRQSLVRALALTG
jgi:RNA polymerase sigma-70 factor (ECF subfamily)